MLVKGQNAGFGKIESRFEEDGVAIVVLYEREKPVFSMSRPQRKARRVCSVVGTYVRVHHASIPSVKQRLVASLEIERLL